MNNNGNNNGTAAADPDILRALTREGVLINVSVRYWRGCRKLKAEDLGLDPDKVNDRLISLGQKRLLPKEATAELALVEGRAHALVDVNTFPFLGGIARFLPNAKLEEVQSGLNDLEGEFRAARERFLGGYETNRVRAMEEWTDMSRQLTDHPGDLLSAIRMTYPEIEKLENRFAFEVRLFQLAAPQDMSRQLMSFGEQREVIQARRLASREAAQQIRADAEAFVGDCVRELREQTAQLCEEMLASMDNSQTEGGVHQRTLNRLTNFIDRFRQLNFAGDQEMEAQLENVRRELLSRSALEYRESPTARRSLTQGLARMRDHARDLATRDSRELVERFGQLGRRRLELAV